MGAPNLLPDQLPWLLYGLVCLVGLGGVILSVAVGVVLLPRARRRQGTVPEGRETGRRIGAGRLVVREGTCPGQVIALPDGVTRIGREAPYADVSVDDAYMSNPHFAVEAAGDSYYIVDEASTNGTRVDGVALVAHQRVALEATAVIEAGQTRLQFVRTGTRDAADGNPFATTVLCDGDRRE